MMFPFYHASDQLAPDDLELFAPDFSEVVLSLFPYAAGPVSFRSFRPEAAADSARRCSWSSSESQPHDRYLEQVQKTRQPVVVIPESLLYLPIWQGTELLGVALLAGIDGGLLKKVSAGWLDDRSRIISREFSLIKRQAHDPVTGLLNIHHLHKELDYLLKEATSFTLFLVEVWPRGTNAAKALRQIIEAASYLGSLLGHLTLHHLGWGVFACVWPGTSEKQAQKFAKTLLDLMKRESFGQVHLGMTSAVFDLGNSATGAPSAALTAEAALGQAWQALQTAGLRGPYALCSYSSISNFDQHPLHKPPAQIMRLLQAAWHRLDGFAVVLLRPFADSPSGNDFAKTVSQLLGDEARLFVTNGQEIYALLDSPDREKALTWTRGLQKKMSLAGAASSLAGIAVFPDHVFKKADLPANARKAMLHTRFYGPDTATVFDAVSLNISGDIYYSEGDLNRAVREYRLGLAIDPDNINLMNSLGEAHGRMNRHQKAVLFFRRVLRLDAANFMALFNLGVTYLVMKDEAKAIKYLEKALALRGNSQPAALADFSDEGRAGYDLFFQLGRLYCQAGRYEEAIGLLTQCVVISDNIDSAESEQRQSVRRGSCYRYLGVAYKESGNNREAISVLQRAIRFNPRDAISLSLLGELYCLEKQGDDIAISLCSQALDLDDTRWEHWYRLALIRFRQGQFEQARALLVQSLRRDRKSIPAMRMLGQVYQEIGRPEEAVKMIRKLLRLKPADAPAKEMLAKLRKENRRISKEQAEAAKESINV